MGKEVTSKRRQSPVTTLVAQRLPNPYLIQWERVLRWRSRCAQAVADDAGFDAFDFLFALFGGILQMRDWLTASRRDLQEEVADLFRGSENLALVRDLANGSKHMAITSYTVDGAATIAREYWGQGRSRYVVPRPGGRNVEALVLADSCIRELRDFMAERGLSLETRELDPPTD